MSDLRIKTEFSIDFKQKEFIERLVNCLKGLGGYNITYEVYTGEDMQLIDSGED